MPPFPIFAKNSFLHVRLPLHVLSDYLPYLKNHLQVYTQLRGFAFKREEAK